jgi:hypothetical protein
LRESVRSASIALSLANLCYLRVWADLRPENAFFLQDIPTPSYYGALIANVLALALLLWLVEGALRRWRGPDFMTNFPFWMAFITACNSVRLHGVGNQDLTNSPKWLAAGGVLLIVGSVAVTRFGCARCTLAARTISLTVLPFAALTLGLAATRLVPPPSAGVLASPSVRSAEKPTSRRVLLLIFDELDYRPTFPERPRGLNLGHFDSLMAESVFFEHAIAPARDTLLAVPSILLGKPLVISEPTAPGELSVRAEGEPASVPLTGEPHLFASLNSRGFDSAAVGWCLPYCRLFGDSLASCEWRSYLPSQESTRTLFQQQRAAFFSVPFTYRLLNLAEQATTGTTMARRVETERNQAHIDQYVALQQAASRIATDRRFAFVFLHLPIPHKPYVWDRSSESFTTRTKSYLDNLALVDRSLGLLRDGMAAGGTWDDTAVIVTSDHALRSSAYADRRVPLLVKLPGRKRAARFLEPVETVRLYELVPALLTGDIASPETLGNWLVGRERGGRPGSS